MIAKGLLILSSLVFAATGLVYLAMPGLALGIVGIESSPVSEFLLRTEGVPLLFGSVLVWIVRDGHGREVRIALIALAAYYVASSVIDVAAYAEGVVGWASVPSAFVRIAVGVVCGAAARYSGRHPQGTRVG